MRAEPGKLPDSGDVACPLGDADSAGSIQKIEGVRTFEAVIVGREHHTGLDQLLALLLIGLEPHKMSGAMVRIER